MEDLCCAVNARLPWSLSWVVFWRIVWVQPNLQKLIEAALSIRKGLTVLLETECPYTSSGIKAMREGISEGVCLSGIEILRLLLIVHRTPKAIQVSFMPSRSAITGILGSTISPLGSIILVDRDCIRYHHH